LILIDSATLQPVTLEKAESLPDFPQAGPTDTAADIPSMLQAALDYITTNQTGRTDVWLLSDLRQSDWNAGGGRWQALRSAFGTLPGVRFQVLAYQETQPSDMGISVEHVTRRETADKAELLLDIRLQRNTPVSEKLKVPLRVVVNGTASTLEPELKGNQVLLQAQAIPIDKATKRGWGRIELPADSSPSDNVFNFVFDEPPAMKSVIVSDRGEVSGPLLAALSAPADPSRKYEAAVLPAARTAEIGWDDTALIVWQAPLPNAESAVAKQLAAHVKAGRSLLFLPPDAPDGEAFQGIHWTKWETAPADKPVLADWWRSDTGLLSGTRAGTALPVGEVEAQRWCSVEGEFVPLARLGDAAGKAPLLLQTMVPDGGRAAFFLTTAPGPGSSSLARDGVVLFAMLHRALNEGAASLGNAQQRLAGAKSLGEDAAAWTRLDVDDPATVLTIDRPLRSGVLKKAAAASGKPDLLAALNRPPGEDASPTLGKPALDELFSGLDWRLLERTLENEKSLTSEVWRTFLWAMAAALILEALLCMPGRRQTEKKPDSMKEQPA
ncbi:MAG TPA: hypothetical protein VHM91_00570, partial [Verrucomicrobiales bacterium]|nr:hypothetical protein [Verrucomicrobiales bacterium]